MILFEILFRPGAFSLARFFWLGSQTSLVNSNDILWFVRPRFSEMRPFVWCQGYFHMAHVHLDG